MVILCLDVYKLHFLSIYIYFFVKLFRKLNDIKSSNLMIYTEMYALKYSEY